MGERQDIGLPAERRNAFKGKISYSENGGTELLLEMSQRKCKAVFRISPSIPAAAVGKYRRGRRERM